MIRKLSKILGCALLVGAFLPRMVCAMTDEEGKDSPQPSRVTKNVENETKKAGEKTGKVVGKAVDQTEKATKKAAGQVGKGLGKLGEKLEQFSKK